VAASKKRQPKPPPLPSFPSDELALVNAMDRSLDPLAVAVAALTHYALTRRPVPNYHDAMNAHRHADVVLAALYRRGMLNT
jgi:hypothetical protein